MKYKILSVLAIGFFIIVGTTKAQTVNYGIKGGLSLSNLYIDEEELDDENSRMGFNVGFYSQFMVANTFGIQPEFLYSTKGAEGEYSGFFDQSVEFKLNYIDIPVLAVFKPIEVLEFHVGPYFGFLLNSNIEYSGTIEGNDELDRDNFNTLDYGLAGGVGLNFGSMQAGVRYNLGLQNIADSDAADVLLGDSKNSYGQLYIAFKL